MNVEIFVHGVPYGESFWGKDNDDRDYFGVFMTKVVQIELSFSFRHVHTKVRHIVTIIIWCIKML